MPKQAMPNVVIVDDERVIAETLTIILKENGFCAVFFTNPLDALESAQTAPPDLLISNYCPSIGKPITARPTPLVVSRAAHICTSFRAVGPLIF